MESKSKAIIILQSVPMVLQMVLMSMVPIVIVSDISVLGTDFELANTAIIITILVAAATFCGIFAGVVSLVGAIKKNGCPPVHTTLAVKLLSIPFYIVAGILWTLLAGGMLNPFLMLGIPVEIAMAVGCTYVYVIGTSIPCIIYSIVYGFKYKKSPTAAQVVATIFLFLFVLDLVGAIILVLKRRTIFPEKFPPLTEEQAKKKKKRIIILSVAIVVIFAVMVVAARLNPKNAVYYLYSNELVAVRDDNPYSTIDIEELSDGYVFLISWSDEKIIRDAIDTYNDFVDKHSFYLKRIGKVTFVFYERSPEQNEEIYRFSADNEKITDYPELISDSSDDL